MLPKPVVDYRRFRLNRLNTPEFSHLKLLIFWPVYTSLFFMLEHNVFGDTYTPVEIGLDSMIPFCEWFLIPYVGWFFFLLGIHIYTLLYDIPSFKRLIAFMTITYFGTILIYLIFPTCQNLRPESFERDNIFTRYLAGYYDYDSNTNVCPSIHVAGSWAVVCGAWKSRHFSKPWWRVAFVLVAVSITLSTCFVKQHSALDTIVAIPLMVLGWYVAMGIGKEEAPAPAKVSKKKKKVYSMSN